MAVNSSSSTNLKTNRDQIDDQLNIELTRMCLRWKKSIDSQKESVYFHQIEFSDVFEDSKMKVSVDVDGNFHRSLHHIR